MTITRTFSLTGSVIAAGVFLILSGCSPRTDSGVRVESLASGVIQTTYTELSLRPLTLDTVAVWDVWSGEAGYLFSRITTAVGSGNGFYILDSGNRQVVETDLAGRVRNVFGGRGEGPGEFGFPRFLNVVDDEVWVGDLMPRRFSVFDRNGQHRRTITMQFGLAPDANRCAVLPDGRVLNALDALDGTFSLLAWNLQTQTADTLATLASLPPIVIELHHPDGSVAPFDTRPTFSDELHWSWDPAGGLLTVTGTDYVFEERSLDGRIVRRTLAPTPDLTVSASDREYFFAHAAFSSSDGSGFSEAEVRSRWEFAERRQAIGRVRIDPRGYIWVLAHTPDIEHNRIDIFDPEHRYRGSFEAPALPLTFAADGTALLRVTEGAYGGGLFYTARLP